MREVPGFAEIIALRKAEKAARTKISADAAAATAARLALIPQEDGITAVDPRAVENKIFVIGLASETTIDTIRAYFEVFGAVEDAIIAQGLPEPTKPQPV